MAAAGVLAPKKAYKHFLEALLGEKACTSCHQEKAGENVK